MPLNTLLFPEFSQEPSADCAFSSLGPKKLVVVYEAHRDFMSAPRQHIALCISFAEAITMNSSGEWLSDIHWRQIKNKTGVFLLESSEVVLKRGEQHILIVHNQGLLEFCATQVEQVSSVFHQATSQCALFEIAPTLSFDE